MTPVKGRRLKLEIRGLFRFSCCALFEGLHIAASSFDGLAGLGEVGGGGQLSRVSGCGGCGLTTAAACFSHHIWACGLVDAASLFDLTKLQSNYLY